MPESAVLEYSVLEQAAEWFAVLGAPDARAADHAAWQRWLDASAAHREAWRRVEQLHAQLHALPGAPARTALMAGPRRRRTIKALLLLLCAGGGAASLAWRPAELRNYVAARNAEHRTGVGAIATLPLPDRTRGWLNTDSAADVAYDDSQRLIILRRGEILLHSGADAHAPARPLVVEANGQRLRALGTRFSVRMTEQGTRLAVYQGAVEIGTQTVVPAGSQVDIVDGHPGPLVVSSEEASAWSRHLLIATQMRLDEFLRELGRYRHGHLGCDPALAELRVVGSYPLDDTERALTMLQAALPVQVRHTLSWWVTVVPR
ncbi:FecR domain-containing protein [Duganella guangzhouensis]|nr:FecR domain-containing protein [Duganella guangzhouensis]